MFDPAATYRIQFNKDFTFSHLEHIIPYLQQLGIKTLYASPIFEAVPGSTHGYDVTDPHRVNPEIGTLKQLRQVTARLKDAGINWVQDIVPNHMAFDVKNSWLMDVFEKGSLSAYASFFDTSGTSELFEGRIMVPFLGAPLTDVISKGELKLGYTRGSLFLGYYDSQYPLNISGYSWVISSIKTKDDSLKKLLQQIKQAHQVDDVKAFCIEFNELKSQFNSLFSNAEHNALLTEAINSINKSSKKLEQLADEQYYRLCNWQETDSRINFRRFFTVNGLICLNMQNPQVFAHYHKFISQLLKEGVFQGLRVDHVDGLYDPAGYLQQLRKLTGNETYIVVEKILEKGERLPADWPVQGATGYEFLAAINNLLTHRESEKQFTSLYQKVTGRQKFDESDIWEKKAYILHNHMAGELVNLTRYFCELNLIDEETHKQIAHEKLKEAIAKLLIYCPVYRYYGNSMPLQCKEAANVENILKQVKNSDKELKPVADLLEAALLKLPSEKGDDYAANALRFYQRCMQLTGPLMAKGVEDTLMYTYNRFVAHNEVGDAPDAFGISVDDFHALMQDRQQHWPLALNGTSTHDTKRGEDVRARLNALSAMPDVWGKLVEKWLKENVQPAEGKRLDVNDVYLIFQTIAGAYPMPSEGDDGFEQRIHEYLEKALREGKQHSQWAGPDEEYETASKSFASALLKKDSAFWQSFRAFHKQLADHGIINSLVQVALKFTAPGVPDVYQGCDRWDLSLVDPDNRRPVDYTLSGELLNAINQDDESLIEQLWNDRYSAKIKLWFTNRLLSLRGKYPDLFAKGQYIPLKVKGKYKAHVIAFARQHGRQWLVSALPLHLPVITPEFKAGEINWASTRVILPATLPNQYTDELTGLAANVDGGELYIKDVFKPALPLAVLNFKRPENPRGSGLLMHITSLPSNFGVGDLGPQAMAFADALKNSLQKYWQLLPLSPTEMLDAHSPYSSFSSMAGNTLLISPELLAADGLLTAADLKDNALPSKIEVDYAGAERVKTHLFNIAWANFKKGSNVLQDDFNAFCLGQAAWLNDFALYVVIKHHHAGKPWFEWHTDYMQRNDKSLKGFARKYADEITKIKWLQFIFARQWNGLRSYCNDLGIKLFGDLPFYVSYDSADVWANREIFSLNAEGKMQGVAGVPPDYFNADGQLWGMPVFCWNKLKQTNYKWWVDRVKKNMELFDILRLDHFRAFAAYWEVPAGESTAINGQWQQGPGKEFFEVLQKEMGWLPLVAEDLGDIDDAVYELRDGFNLPGMKVLQFAFGDNMPQSAYIPHNYTENFVAYTGTHDNNTTAGWYKQDADKQVKKQLAAYSGIKTKQGNVHEVMAKLAFGSVAKMAILPVQDLLGLDEDTRMNTPASTAKNWLWRLKPGQLDEKHIHKLLHWTILYNRA
ncbi:malto-oligosyltrehalose synthase [Mucilaginibacter sp. UR6-1]|uniref:malto-oligosyltrehalose synthase n=1 Tax=Mucilaginibacter sp. UR6-1 TaxID=1435643 RepID=UPI001E3EADC4|nr:malto-oligosyltrehalose synthase [Mucilaginibacter sp. UR6-1]MCC8407553.1 malto-oligosyltrehalose synthase [Mucilaginibacter sp. UR6-1]